MWSCLRSAELLDAQEVAGGIADGAVPNAIRLLGRFLDHLAVGLYPPAATPGITDNERRTIAEMMAKGTIASINLATPDLDATFERVQANGEVVQEPTE